MPLSSALPFCAALVLAVFVASRSLYAWRRYHGQRLIQCPGNQRPAGVRVDAARAAITGIVSPRLRLSDCSRWPEMASCGQECLSQVESAPEDCLVRNIVTRWYQGKSCVWCGRPFQRIQWTAARPGFLKPDGVSAEWSAVPVDRLRETMASALPVCFACHIADRMVRERPELIVDRSVRDKQ